MIETIRDQELLQPVLDKGWATVQLDPHFTEKLLQTALLRLSENGGRPAGLSMSQSVNSSVRTDSIYWIDETAKDLLENEKLILNQLNTVVQRLKAFFLMPVDHVECHWAHYKNSQFYKRHKDTTSVNNRRLFSFVIYLNKNWKDEDGGQNVGYDQAQELWRISPEFGRLLLFKSDIEHEVLPTNKDRFSLTGWFRSI